MAQQCCEEHERIENVMKLYGVEEQMKTDNLKILMNDILANSEFETRDKENFDTHMLLKYDGQIIRKLIYLVLDKQNRNKNFQKAVHILSEFQKVKDGKADLDHVLQTEICELENEYIYPVFGGKEAFERKFKNP